MKLNGRGAVRLDVDALPGRAVRAVVCRILQDPDRVSHVRGGDRRTVFPIGVRHELERVGSPVVGPGPGFRQIGQYRAVRPLSDEASEQQGDQILIRLGTRGERVDRTRVADDPFAVRHERGARPAGLAIVSRRRRDEHRSADHGQHDRQARDGHPVTAIHARRSRHGLSHSSVSGPREAPPGHGPEDQGCGTTV